jgi:L-arabinose isomerase
VNSAFCTERDEVEGAISQGENNGANVLVIVLLSYSPSLVSLPALVRTKLPIVVWNTQRLRKVDGSFTNRDLIDNHGMHGVQDLTNVLKRSGVGYGLVSGHYRDADSLDELRSWIRSAVTAFSLRDVKVGLLGRPFQDMGDFGVDETLMVSKWGPTAERLTLDELVSLVQEAPEGDIRSQMEFDRQEFDVDPEVDEEVHRASSKLEWALRRQVENRGLSAITMNFRVFGEDPRIETIPFLGINKLIASGYGYAGEGNVTVAALSAVLTRLWGESNFTEMFTADYANDEIFMNHMGEGNYNMARKDTRVKMKRAEFKFGRAKPYTALVFGIEPGPATFVNVTTDSSENFYLIGFEAEVVDFPLLKSFTSPHYKVKVDRKLGSFLTSYSELGGTHHISMCKGNRLKDVEKLTKFLRIPLRRV